MSIFFRNFALKNYNGKENNMQAAVAMPQFDQVLVSVPHVELKRFKTIIKALDCKLIQRTELEEAIDEVESGRVKTMDSIDDFIAAL